MTPPVHSTATASMCWIYLILLLVSTPAAGDFKSLMDKLKMSSQVSKLIASNDVKDLIFGPCSATCGVGFQEIYWTSGCPDNKPKCLAGYRECKGPPDCGWGMPVAEKNVLLLRMACISVAPENRFTYKWKMLAAGQEPQILTDKTRTLHVFRGIEDLRYQCDTWEKNYLVASIKYQVTSDSKGERDHKELILTIIILVGLLTLYMMATIGVFLYWILNKSVQKGKSDLENQMDTFTECETSLSPVTLDVESDMDTEEDQIPTSAPADIGVRVDTVSEHKPTPDSVVIEIPEATSKEQDVDPTENEIQEHTDKEQEAALPPADTEIMKAGKKKKKRRWFLKKQNKVSPAGKDTDHPDGTPGLSSD